MPSLQLLNCWTCLIINVESPIHTRDAVPQAEVCGVRAPKQTSKVHFELQARPNDQIHTQYVKMDGLERVFT